MRIRRDRIERAQERIRAEGLVGLMIMNHDDYRYFFGADRSQPRAIIPFDGPPVLIAFAGEEPELRRAIGDGGIEIFTHVGEQIGDVIKAFQGIVQRAGPPPAGAKPRVGMQMWFETPAFLVDLFRRVNPRIELVESDPVMDPLRGVKDPGEIDRMREAQRIAARGMDLVRGMLGPGVRPREIAIEVLHAMQRAGADGTSTPIYVNAGIQTCMLHGGVSPDPLAAGDPVVIDLTPRVDGYCANLARTFVLGEPAPDCTRLLDAYAAIRAAVLAALRPGATVKDLDARGKEVAAAHGLDARYVEGITHGIGLRFEETPAPTIRRPHRNLPIGEGMTVTIGHTILALPGVAGVRHEDVYRVGPAGAEALHPYPVEPVV